MTISTIFITLWPFEHDLFVNFPSANFRHEVLGNGCVSLRRVLKQRWEANTRGLYRPLMWSRFSTSALRLLLKDHITQGRRRREVVQKRSPERRPWATWFYKKPQIVMDFLGAMSPSALAIWPIRWKVSFRGFFSKLDPKYLVLREQF